MSTYIETVGAYFPLKELESGRFRTFRVGPMTNRTRHFDAEGFGHISLMESSALFGLMKMTTFNVTPIQVDMPLLSFDIISVPGSKTILNETYDAFLRKENFDETGLLAVKESIRDLPDYHSKPCWYDSLRMKSSWAKKVRKDQVAKGDAAALALLETYMEAAAKMPKLMKGEITIKKEIASAFAMRLIEEGGVPTDLFVKKIGKDETVAFFHEIFYGV